MTKLSWNNWAVELETYRIKFEHIKGKSNVLADTLSRLISIDTDVKLEPELEGYEFGQYCFEELPKASSYTVNEIITDKVMETHDTDITEPITTYSIPLPSFKIHELQESDKKLCWLHPRIKKGQLTDSGYFIDTEDDLLWWRISDNLQDFEPVVLPNSLISTALLLTHDHNGHNGFRRTYAALKWLYYWKGIKKDILMHCKHCQVCAKQKVERTKYIKRTLDLDTCPWDSSPWIWWVDSLGPPVATNMPSQLSVCWQATYSVFPWRPKQQRELWTNTSPR